MSSFILRALRTALLRRQNTTSSATRRKFHPRVESLEPRLMLDGPHGGAGTLFDEHEAVMHLVEFQEIHSTASSPTYYVARDADKNPDTPNLWSDLISWVKKTYMSGGFVESVADHLPTTGDDVEIPAGLNFIYDISPDAFKIPTLPGMDPAKTSVKNNLRLRTVSVEGSLTFQPNADLLMYFETLVVSPTGALTINEDPSHNVRQSMVSLILVVQEFLVLITYFVLILQERIVILQIQIVYVYFLIQMLILKHKYV